MKDLLKVDSPNDKTAKENYERMLFAIAVLYSAQIGVDIRRQDQYSALTEEQKTFARKIYEKTPSLQRHVQSPERISEQLVVEDISQLSQTRNNSEKLRIVTVGDDRVCPACEKWRDVVVSLNGAEKPTLDDAIKDGFLHYGCRCSLQELNVGEIQLNPLDPRYDARRAANPAAYNLAPTNNLVFA